MPELAGDLAVSWLSEQFQRAEQLRADAAVQERAAFRAWQEAMAAYDAANDSTTDAWAVLVTATGTEDT